MRAFSISTPFIMASDGNIILSTSFSTSYLNISFFQHLFLLLFSFSPVRLLNHDFVIFFHSILLLCDLVILIFNYKIIIKNDKTETVHQTALFD
jgi:hypothetical protein